MKDLIDVCLARANVKYLSKQVHIISSLNYYKVVFQDRYGSYRKFEAFYNDTDIFSNTNNRKLLQADNKVSFDCDFSDRVLSSITDHSSFADCNDCSIQDVSQGKIDSFLLRIRRELVQGIYCISIPEVTIDFVDLVMKPTCVVIIRYRVNGLFMQPIRVFLGDILHRNEFYWVSTDFCLEINKLLEKFVLKRI